MAGILFEELTRKDLSKKLDTGEEFKFYPSIFLQNFVSFLVVHP